MTISNLCIIMIKLSQVNQFISKYEICKKVFTKLVFNAFHLFYFDFLYYNRGDLFPHLSSSYLYAIH